MKNTSQQEFEAWLKSIYLDNSMEFSDAWGHKKYLPHIQSMWLGWEASRAALKAENCEVLKVKPLQWSEEREPCDECRYNHVVAESPLGKASIEWKGWKKHDSYSLYIDGENISNSGTLKEAKLSADQYIMTTIQSLIEPSSGNRTDNKLKVDDQKVVPAGYMLVPIEPTDEIIDAMDNVISLAYNQSNARQKYKARHTYKAILTAVQGNKQ